MLDCFPARTLKTDGPWSPSSVTYTVPEAEEGLLRPRMCRPFSRLIVSFLVSDNIWIWFSEDSKTSADELKDM